MIFVDNYINESIITALYKEQIDEEEKLIKQLDDQIKELEAIVNKQRKSMGG